MKAFKTALIYFLAIISFNRLWAQQEQCKTQSIANMEGRAFEKLQRPVKPQSSTNFNVTYYRCEWEIDPALYYIKGKVTLFYTITTASNSLSLDLMNSLITDSVIQRGNKLPFTHSSNTIQVNYASQMPVNLQDSITIFYKGPPANTGFGSFVQTTHNGVPVIWTLSEPFGSRDWWPCKNGLDDKADSIDIIITTPIAYKATANGLLQKTETIANGTKAVFYFKHRYPIASYLVAFSVTNFVDFTTTIPLGTISMPMQTYCYPESLSSFQAGAQNTSAAMQLFHNRFGSYPFIKEKYGHTQFLWGGGMEHQTNTFLVNVSESLVAHEMAHQWFGDKVTCASWKDIWLNEGFATQLANMYLENKYPTQVLSIRQSDLNYITSQPGGSVQVDDTNSVNRIFDGRLTYTKGSYLLYMLRWKMGDSTFYKAATNYLNDPAIAYNFATTSQLKAHMEKASGLNLTEFFNDWFTGQGYPSYQLEWYPLGDQYIMATLKQTTSHTSVPFFEMPVEVVFKNGTASKSFILDHKTNAQSFKLATGFVPDTALIDPGLWIISKNNTVKKITDPTPGSNLVSVYPNPVSDVLNIELRKMLYTTAYIQLFNGLGQRLLGLQKNVAAGYLNYTIPMGAYPSGLYYVRIQYDDGSHKVYKILKP